MANAPQMKIPIGAETQDFEKGARKVKQEMKDLDKVSSDAFSAIGNAIGLDTGKLQQLTSAAQGLGNKLVQTGSEGVKAFGAILKSIGPVATGIAGLGIAGVVTGFKLLNSEAEAFKNTVQGANVEMATSAYISTYVQVLHDMKTATGESVAETQSQLSKLWGRFKADIGDIALGVIAQGQTVGQALAMNLFRGAIAQVPAEQAGELTSQIYALERQRKEQAVELARINAEIADQMSIARDASYTIAERQQAISTIQGLINQKEQMSVALEQQLAALYKERSDLASDDIAAADATLAQQQRLFETERAITTEKNSLLRLSNQLVKASAADAAAVAAEAAATQQLVESRRSLAEWAAMSSVSGVAGPGSVQSQQAGPGLSFIPTVSNWAGFFKDVDEAIYRQYPGGLTIGVTFDAEEGLTDLTAQINSVLTDLASTTSEAIGQLMGDLATGGDAWGNFANAALSSLGDMAISVGKMAIAVGTATLGIKAALESLNGYVAIAAGMALVALGAAVKSGLSNIASGNYSASASTLTSGSSSAVTTAFAEKEITVNVTGTLVGQGSALLGVINSENNRRRSTT